MASRLPRHVQTRSIKGGRRMRDLCQGTLSGEAKRRAWGISSLSPPFETLICFWFVVTGGRLMPKPFWEVAAEPLGQGGFLGFVPCTPRAHPLMDPSSSIHPSIHVVHERSLPSLGR